jgi:mono/diheme cytochrome c family protein
VPPTEAPVVVTVGAETMTAGSTQALDPEKVSLGKGRYEALDCGSCHGGDAKGTDKGKALVPNKLTEDQFIDFLRTGGNVGNTHLYSTNRLSDAGGKNLYVYILSLSAGS